MNEMVESVLLLCPECDREKVENDLDLTHLTGDLERTINHALDGMLSPWRKALQSASPSKAGKQVIVMDDSDDDIIALPSTSKYTSITIKEKTTDALSKKINCTTDYNINNIMSTVKDIKETSVLKPRKSKTDTFLEISDSDSEMDETYKTYKSNIVSRKYNNDNIKSFRAQSPDSDNESLPPAFGNHEYESTLSRASKDTNKEISQISVPEKNSSSLSALSNDNIVHLSTLKDMGIERNCPSDQSTCIEEPVKKKKKRSREEIEEQKRTALIKKKAREKERQEKLDGKKKQKEARAAEIQQKKSEAEKDKLEKKAEKLTSSTLKLGGCVKFVTVCLDPSLFNEDDSGLNDSIILQKLCSIEANYKIKQQPHPGSITWQRTSVQHSVHKEQMMITSSNTYNEENEVLVVLAAEEFAEMVYSFKQKDYQTNCNVPDQNECQTLVDFTKNLKVLYRDKKITFLLVGLEKYMRNVKTKQNRAFRDAAIGSSDETAGNRKRRKRKLNPTVNVTRTDIEEALVDLQIKTNVCIYLCETDKDLATKVTLFTKAVAERPFKKSLSDGFAFCLDKLDKTSLKVSKDGQGLVRVWQQQIEQFRNVSREMAAAIVAVFPSPKLLLKAYERCTSEREALLLLEDILVRRGGGSLATSRRIGPELSKRFYILFHSKDSGELMKR